jgi:UDP-N-acetylglucosamine 2-epimerase (hydrolysing)
VVILPNNDPGSNQILDVIHSLPTDRFRVLPSMRFSYFSELMRHAAVIVGNSSMGVREAPFLGVPSIDIGSRQSNRATASSLWHANAFDSKTILWFLKEHWAQRFPQSTSFGAGDSSRRFVDFLNTIDKCDKPFQKLFIE